LRHIYIYSAFFSGVIAKHDLTRFMCMQSWILVLIMIIVKAIRSNAIDFAGWRNCQPRIGMKQHAHAFISVGSYLGSTPLAKVFHPKLMIRKHTKHAVSLTMMIMGGGSVSFIADMLQILQLFKVAIIAGSLLLCLFGLLCLESFRYFKTQGISFDKKISGDVN
jgi:hypothetical protein